MSNWSCISERNEKLAGDLEKVLIIGVVVELSKGEELAKITPGTRGRVNAITRATLLAG